MWKKNNTSRLNPGGQWKLSSVIVSFEVLTTPRFLLRISMSSSGHLRGEGGGFNRLSLHEGYSVIFNLVVDSQTAAECPFRWRPSSHSNSTVSPTSMRPDCGIVRPFSICPTVQYLPRWIMIRIRNELGIYYICSTVITLFVRKQKFTYQRTWALSQTIRLFLDRHLLDYPQVRN